MKISAKFTFFAGIVFALFAFTYALVGGFSTDAGVSATELADARGYIFFWAFLGCFGVLMAVLSWLIIKGRLGGEHDD